MNSPGTTRSSRLLMSSRPRFIDDGMGSVQRHCYFSQLSSCSHALLRPFKAYVGAREYTFHPSLNRSQENGIRSTTSVSLQTSDRSFQLLVPIARESNSKQCGDSRVSRAWLMVKGYVDGAPLALTNTHLMNGLEKGVGSWN
jgi:hypothetical protein